jgi:hypothetical protein
MSHDIGMLAALANGEVLRRKEGRSPVVHSKKADPKTGILV